MIFRVPTIWRNLSRIDESLRSYVMPDGTLRSYTDVGCYPIFYATNRDECLCAKCASTMSDTSFVDYDRVVAADVNWSDQNMACDACEESIESAYGDVDQDMYDELAYA